ncbi:MAG: VCBS repeat-containing protein [Bacteroidota bacterium]
MTKYWKQLLTLIIILQACSIGEESTHHSTEGDKLFTLLSARATGIDFTNTIEEDEKNNHLINDMFVAGSGVAVGDINNDSLPDLYFAGNQVPDKLYLNKGNMQFEDITESAGIKKLKTWSTGVTFADVNNDGLLDIYVCKSVQDNMQLSENLLYINKGDLTFEERAADYKLADRGLSIQANFVDFDKDGLIDLYLVNQPPSVGKRQGNGVNTMELSSLLYSDKFFKNMNGSFVDVTLAVNVNNYAYGLSATAGDFNNDSWPDVYVTNDFDRPDHLYMNARDSSFNNRANIALKHMSNFSMGSDVADYDNDGLLDIFTVDMVAEDHKRIKTYMGGMQPENFWKTVKMGWHYQYMFNALQKNNGNGTFSEIAQLAGVSSTDWSWGPLFADFDNDGWKDLFVTNGIKRNQRYADAEKQITRKLDSLEVIAKKEGKQLNDLIDVMDFVEMFPVDKLENYVARNNGDLTFSKKIEEWGLDIPTLSHGASYADLDLDGDIDLIVSNVDDVSHIYRNNTVERGLGNYLKVGVKNQFGAPAYGARIKVYQDGSMSQMVELTNVRGYMSKSEDVAHFGLGDIKTIEKVEVTWPDGKYWSKENVPANSYLIPNYAEAGKIPQGKPQKPTLFFEVADVLEIDYKHKENNFNDFRREVLLPHKMSKFGPGLTVGDINGDGLDDFYVGGAVGHAGALFIQTRNEKFVRSDQPFLEEDKIHEDMGAVFFDADSDGDLDLFVTSGGNEHLQGTPEQQDRLYFNNGKGKLSRNAEALPDMTTSNSRVYPADFDGDGDMDLFVGGRMVPGQYPKPTRSYILRNEGGKFTDITEKVSPELMKAGMVTAAEWVDFNGDGQLDLTVVGEWMPVMMLRNDGDLFTNITASAGLENTTGWYFDIASADFDGDGDMDLIAGNLGLNYKYKASEEEPFEVYSSDFDDNGSLDIVLSYYEHGESFPVRGRSCSSEQIPELQEKFPTYESFGEANLFDVYGDNLETALHYQAKTFASSYIENKGDGTFEVKPLPLEAQFSSINNILIKDVNLDGKLDLLMSGNLYTSEIETPRNDAGMGVYLTGDGQGNFEAVPLSESGFFAPHDAKDMKLIKVGKQKKEVVLVANNDGKLQALYWDKKVLKEEGLISLK